MLARAALASCALLLAAIAAQAGLVPSNAQTPRPLDAPSVESHHVLTGGCAGGDLHVMRYAPAEQEPGALVATWCR
jgi:hypothetical protein